MNKMMMVRNQGPFCWYQAHPSAGPGQGGLAVTEPWNDKALVEESFFIALVKQSNLVVQSICSNIATDGMIIDFKDVCSENISLTIASLIFY